MEMSKQHKKLNGKLLVFPAPFQGHQNPMLHLANLLYSKGFSITVIQTPYKPINPSHFPHFTFHLLVNTLLESYTKAPPPDAMDILASVNTTCSEPFKDCLSQILRKGEPVAALIADPVCTFISPIASSFNLPRITLRTGSISTLLVYSSLSRLRETGFLGLQGDKLDEVMPEFHPLKVKDLPLQSEHNRLESYVQEIKTSKGVICNTFEELEYYSLTKLEQNFTIPIFAIGPLHKHSPTSAHDQNSISWLSTQSPNSVLYVSFGTVAPLTKEEFLEIAWGLKESMVPFLWVVRQGLTTNDSLPEDYLQMIGERGHIIKWAPQLEVLAHPAIGGFWTHNGWNSTLESISEGVPMLCQPLIYDQGMNARHVSDGWRVGLMMEPGTKRKEIARVIIKLMLEEEGEQIRSRAKSYKEKASLCIKEGGSSYNYLERLSRYLLSFQ